MSKINLKNKTLILVAGYPGSGKTYLAERLAKKIQAVYIDKDQIDDVFCVSSRISEEYNKYKPYVHKLMYALAGINLRVDNSVILDSPFARRYMGNKEWLKFIKSFAKKHKATIKVIWCEASDNVRKTRIVKRGHGRDKERFHQIDEFVGKAQRFDIPFEHIYAETSKLNWQKIVKFLKA